VSSDSPRPPYSSGIISPKIPISFMPGRRSPAGTRRGARARSPRDDLLVDELELDELEQLLLVVGRELTSVGGLEVGTLEALWWADDMTHFTSARDKSTWYWTMLNLVPEWITDEHVDVVRERVEAKGGAPALPLLRRAVLNEGLSVQTLHIGPYDAEAPTLERLHDEVIPAAGLRMTGHHHEIYLSDARRTAVQRLRTILRQPVEPVPPTPK
jgi:hypothetical protein